MSSLPTVKADSSEAKRTNMPAVCTDLPKRSLGPGPCKSKSSRDQQDLSDAALFCHRVSPGRLTERQLQANRDYQLAVSHRFGHELERFPVVVRKSRRHLY